MPTVLASLTELGMTSKKGENSKELYVVALCVDRNTSTAPAEEPAVLIPNQAKHLNAGSFSVVASPIYKNVTIENPVALFGNGLVLYPNLDPGGYLEVHFFIVESDDGARSVAGIMSETGKAVAGDEFAGFGERALIAALVQMVAKIVRSNKDDALFDGTYSGFDYNKYGTGDGKVEFPFKNPKVYGNLVVSLH